jgi:hypothetical protein
MKRNIELIAADLYDVVQVALIAPTCKLDPMLRDQAEKACAAYRNRDTNIIDLSAAPVLNRCKGCGKRFHVTQAQIDEVRDCYPEEGGSDEDCANIVDICPVCINDSGPSVESVTEPVCPGCVESGKRHRTDCAVIWSREDDAITDAKETARREFVNASPDEFTGEEKQPGVPVIVADTGHGFGCGKELRHNDELWEFFQGANRFTGGTDPYWAELELNDAFHALACLSEEDGSIVLTVNFCRNEGDEDVDWQAVHWPMSKNVGVIPARRLAQVVCDNALSITDLTSCWGFKGF